ADRIFVPSAAARDVVLGYHPVVASRIAVVPHGYESAHAAAPRTPASDGTLRVALMGQVADPVKGAQAYLPLLDRSRDLPLEWHVFGDVEQRGFGDALRALALGPRIRLHGAYERSRIVEQLLANAIDVAILLPPWPETF